MSENSNQTTLSHVEPRRSQTGLALFEAAKLALSAALADAKRIDDVMSVRVRVEQMALHARQAKDRDLIADAMELQLTAERRLGEMLIVARETGQMSQGGRPRKGETAADREGVFDKVTLAEAGVTYKLSVKAQKLAAFDDDRFADVLQAARDKIKGGGAVVVNPIKDLNTADKKILRAVKEAQLAANQKALPDKKFGVIYADPEWKFKTWSEAGMDRAVENHYPTSETSVIAARPVGDLAADDCVLFMWVTNPCLVQGIEVMAAWGFEYKANFVWDKVIIDRGYWNRARHEILLVGTRGNVPAPAMGTQWESLVQSPRGEPSVKPDWAYEMIEEYFPNLPKIELNARRRRDGWNAWGFEAPDDESGTFQERASTGEATLPADASVASGEADAPALPATDSIRPDEPTDAAGEGSNTLASRPLATEPETGADLSGAEGGGEGGRDPALPERLSVEQQNETIRAGYARTPKASIAELAAATGLKNSTVKMRAKALGLSNPDNQKEASRRLMMKINDERRAAE